jgi:hypothetical protein
MASGLTLVVLVMLNLFQHPPGASLSDRSGRCRGGSLFRARSVLADKWMLKQVQHDG